MTQRASPAPVVDAPALVALPVDLYPYASLAERAWAPGPRCRILGYQP